MLKYLEPGFHIAQGDSRITPTCSGVFIGFDTLQHEKAIELREYLEKHFRITPSDFPYLYHDHVPAKVAFERTKKAYEENQERMKQYFLEKAGLAENKDAACMSSGSSLITASDDANNLTPAYEVVNVRVCG